MYLDNNISESIFEYSNFEDHPDPQGLFVTGGEDGYTKIWANDKSLIREICFPEPINTTCFLNPQWDVLVGHGNKVSIILAKDYQPFDDQEDDSSFNEEHKGKNGVKKEIVTEKTFYNLKMREEELNTDVRKYLNRKSKSRNKYICDESFSFIEGLKEDTRK